MKKRKQENFETTYTSGKIRSRRTLILRILAVALFVVGLTVALVTIKEKSKNTEQYVANNVQHLAIEGTYERDDKIKIKLKGKDNVGVKTSSLDATKITVMLDGVVVNPEIKDVTKLTDSQAGQVDYILTLGKFDREGTLSFKIAAGTLIDTAGNASDEKIVTTDIKIKPKPEILATVANIGDYVAYDANAIDPTTGVAYSYNSLKGAGNTGGNGGYSRRTFTTQSDIRWKVLSKDVSKGEVVLMAADTVLGDPGNKLKIYGETGYLYAEEELNKICSIYGHGNGADISKVFDYQIGDELDTEGGGLQTRQLTGSGARSINVQDINNLTGKTEDTIGKAFNANYGTRPYTFSTIYPTISNKYGTSDDNANLAFMYTSYSYSGTKYFTSGSQIYNMIFKGSANTNNKAYWLASRMSKPSSSMNSFGVRKVENGNVEEALLLATGWDMSDTTSSYEYGVCPVVYLKPNIQTSGKVGDVWQLVQ